MWRGERGREKKKNKKQKKNPVPIDTGGDDADENKSKKFSNLSNYEETNDSSPILQPGVKKMRFRNTSTLLRIERSKAFSSKPGIKQNIAFLRASPAARMSAFCYNFSLFGSFNSTFAKPSTNVMIVGVFDWDSRTFTCGLVTYFSSWCELRE